MIAEYRLLTETEETLKLQVKKQASS